MSKVLVLYHSFTGTTEMLAKEAAKGVEQSSCQVVLKSVKNATAEDLLEADGILFCTPQSFDTISAALKEFLERSWGNRKSIAGKKVSAILVTMTGSEGAMNNLKLIAKHFRFDFVGNGLLIKAAEAANSRQNAEDLGRELAEAILKG